jgi:hypothetical protein
VNTRELALGFPGCRNAETPKPIHAKPFRGFAYRDFMTGEYKGTCPWVSWVPKRRNPFTLTSFQVSHSQDFAMYKDEGSHTWVSQEPKLRSPFTLSSFRKASSRCMKTRGLTPGFPRSQNSKFYTKLFSGFHKSGLCNVRRRGVSHLGFPGAKTLNPIYFMTGAR